MEVFMSEKPERKITFPRGGGILQDITLRAKLVLRLISDPRVSLFLKLLPIGSLAYLVIPDLVPLPFDDAAIIWLATYLFVELCPPGVVQEHLDDLAKTLRVLHQFGTDHPMQDVPWPPPGTAPEGEIIDGEVIERKEQE
jgi:hypothetical protein